MQDFAALRAGRQQLQEICALHSGSLTFFKAGVSYRLYEQETALDPTILTHMTSTATCIESLLDCPGHEGQVELEARAFASAAFQKTEWNSEGSAAIYCRCRSLPLVIRNSDDFASIKPHLERVLGQLSDPSRFAIGEADTKESPDTWYPANAFHTYWLLDALELCRDHFSGDFARFQKESGLERQTNGMLMWAWRTLASETVLRQAGSSTFDPDQLAWSLTIVTRFSTPKISPPPQIRLQILSEALRAFFSAQDPTGTWLHKRPLFHYKNAGNAYCYVFETLSALLRSGLRDAGLRSALKEYSDKLMSLVSFAEASKIRLSDSAVGWSSGHRTNTAYAESWATAAVFSFMQALRRLLGVWTREEALRGLDRRPAEDPVAAEKILVKRGETWSGGNTIAEQLLTMFVNPVRMNAADDFHDPDTKPITEQQARSAILFGPPGTSKTTLARAVAGAIGWDFVELYPSHFVSAGLQGVQKTADEIFTRLMELDRCVVLFDEIDELVREREMEPDAFGRFLTTSMLPRLAELWRQRRILYFVATNHVEYFDHALTRSQRFDALLFVPPPSFASKSARLIELIFALCPGLEVTVSVTQAEIDEDFRKIPTDSAGELHEEHLLAKFILLRWDQLDELAHTLVVTNPDAVAPGRLDISSGVLKKALAKVGDDYLNTYPAYLALVKNEHYRVRDFSKEIVWCIDGPIPASEYLDRTTRHRSDSHWFVGTKDLLGLLASDVKVSYPQLGHISFQVPGPATPRTSARPAGAKRTHPPVPRRKGLPPRSVVRRGKQR